MIKQILIPVGAAFIIAVGSLNGWSWQIAALAEDQQDLSEQIRLLRIDELSSKIYDLEGKAESEDWNARDEARLKQLERQLEQAEEE